MVRRVRDGSRPAERDDEDDDGRVVEAGLGLEQAGQAPGQRHHAQHREDGRGVGRARMAPRSSATDQLEVQHEVRGHADDGRPRRRRRPSTGPRRGRRSERMSDHRVVSAALGEDEDERGVAEDLGERVVVEA